MNLTQTAIDKDRVTLTALVLILVAGLWSFFSLPQNEDPGFVIRTALVTTVFPGATPERVEELVTDKLEEVIQEIPELDFIESESKTGVSLVFVDFREEFTEMRPLFDKLRRKVDRVRDELPDGIIGPTVDDEFGDVFGVIIGLTGGAEFTYRELKDIADEVRDELLLIDEVAKVEIHGAQEERVFVEYNNARLAELGLSPIQLRDILEAQNIIIPGGTVRTEWEELVLEPSGNFADLDEVRQAVIRIPGRSEVVYLRDIADISRGYIDPPKTRTRVSGTPGLALAVSMREGGNIGRLGQAVRKTLDRAKSYYPIGIEFEEVQFQPDAVENKIDDFAANLLQAVGIVTAVMLVFLGLRTGLVVASLIPMAMVASFLVMSVAGIGLDQMSIASLIIALGMLVDNAIVMSESISVQMQEGKPPVRAAVDSATELKTPLLTSSLTTAAAFLPIYLAESSTGEYTAPLFKVVTITLLCSWVLSLTMVPMLCARFLRVKPGRKVSFDTPFYRRYRGVLLLALRHRFASLGIVAGMFVAAIAGLNLVPNVFFPPNDRPMFTIELEMPQGTPLAKTEEIVERVEGHLRAGFAAGPERELGVTGWGSFIGRGAPRFTLSYTPEQSASNYAMMIVNANDRDWIDEAIPRLERFCRDNFPELTATLHPLIYGPPAWPPVEVRLSGRDQDLLFDLVDEVKARLAAVPGAVPLGDDWGAQSKKLFIRVDQPRARRAGITSQDVAVSLQTSLSGLTVTEFREDEDIIPVVLRSVGGGRQDADELETLNVHSQATGRSVPLGQIADVELEWQPSKILRRDRLKTVIVGAAVQAGWTATDVTDALRPWLEEASAGWGPGYSWEFGGELEASQEANASIMAKLPVAALIIVLLLVGQFNSFRRPAIILMTIPLSTIGVVVGLIVARSYMGFMTLLGIISLAGIVINNAIVLLDRIRIEIEDNGFPEQRAVLESAQRRLRPILLTTATTVGGLIPLWLGGGAMWEPMAISIIFGLLFATVLTLGMVPVLYSVLFRVDFRSFTYPEEQDTRPGTART